MVDKLVDTFVENLWLIIVMFCAVVFYSFLQAIVSVLRDWFMAKVFKRKPNGNGSKNGKVLAGKFDELIAVTKANGEKHDKRLAGIETSVGDIHEIVTEKDGDNFPKIRVMEKKVREIWNKVIRGEG